MVIRYARIAEIEEKVTESVGNINLLGELIKIGEATKVLQTKKSVYAIICSVLEKYIAQSLLTSKCFLELFYAYHKEDQDTINKLLAQDQYLICEKFVIFALFLLDGVTFDKDKAMQPAKVLIFFKTLFGIAKVLNLHIEDDNGDKLDKYYLSLVLNKFIRLNEHSPLLIELITDNYLFGYSDLTLFSLDYLYEVVKHVPNEKVMKNILGILINLEMTIEEIFNSGSFFNCSNSLLELPTFEPVLKKKFETLWFTILKSTSLNTELKRLVVKYLQDRIFPYVSHPLMFADFILAMLPTDVPGSALSAESIETQVYALSCTLYLSQTCNYEYTPFYSKLYALLNLHLSGASPFDSSKDVALAYTKLLELSLRSSAMPHALVCAFIKKLGRLAIKGTLTTTISCLGIVLNLIKRHPKTVELIHKSLKAKARVGDPFDETKNDPMDSLGCQSSLWELNYLKKHYSPLVRELVKIFKTKFTAEESMNMEELGKIDYTLTAKREQARVISKLDANTEKLYRLPSKKLKMEDPLFDVIQI